MIRWLVGCIALFPSMLLANSGELPAVEVACDPSTTVQGCVNVITGTFTDTQTTLSLAGSTPLSFQHVYNSLWWNGGQICSGWIHTTRRWGGLTVRSRQWCAEAFDSSGMRVILGSGIGAKHNKRKDGFMPPKRNFHCTLAPESCPGLTNTCSGEIGGSTHLCNIFADYDDNSHEIHITWPSGKKSQYVRNFVQSNGGQNLWLRKEQLPQGTSLNYEGTLQEGLTISVSNAKNKPTGEFLRLQKSADSYAPKLDWKVELSDGRWVRYEGKKLSLDTTQVTQITSSNAPPVKYEYTDHRVEKSKRDSWWIYEKVAKRILPEGRFLGINYYHTGPQQVAGKHVHIMVKDAHTPNRVKELLAPAGHDGTPVVINSFLYHFDVKRQTHGEQFHHGMTDLRDAYNHKTEYTFSEHSRLDAVYHYTGTEDHELYSVDRLYWGKDKQTASLLSRTLEDCNGQVRSCHHFVYDDEHNPIEEHFWGNLSGKNSANPEIKEGKPIKNGCEHYVVKREYSKDRFHNKTKESHPNGRSVSYSYQPDTNLCTAMYVRQGKNILQRVFHEYDDNGAIILSVEDDGSTEELDNLLGVTYRRITRVKNRNYAPCVGLPEEVRHSYLDKNSNREILLDRVVYEHTREGWITREDHYDADDVLRYSLCREFDYMGNVLLEQDALGQLTRRRFDASGNKVWEQGPNEDYHLEFQYDFMDRLIAEDIVLGEGRRYTKAYRYDLMGNKVAEVDIHGNETRYKYNDLHRLVATESPIAFNPLGGSIQATLQQRYDLAGNVCTSVGPDGSATRTSHNIRGQTTQVVHPDGRTESNQYNLNGTLARQIAANGSYTKYTYDVLDRVIAKQIYRANGESLATFRCEYKGELLLSETDAKGNVTSYEYDGAGRKVAVRSEGGCCQIEYDAMGRPYRTIHWADDTRACVQAKDYDLLGRVVEERVEELDGTVCTRVLYSYDHKGNRTGITKFTEDGPRTTHSEYDPLGRIVRVIDPDDTITVTEYNDWFVNEQGQEVLQITVTDAKGAQTITTHNSWDKPVSVMKKGPYGEELSRVQLCYDAHGHQVQRIETVKAPNQEDRLIQTCWKYDSCGRCIQVDEAVGTLNERCTRTSYNVFGEKSSVTYDDGTILHYEYDDRGQLVHYWSSDDSFDYTYDYDSMGNLLEVYDAKYAATTVREYDSQGRVVREQLAHGEEVQFSYDKLGRPVRFTLPDGSSVVYEYNAAHLTQICRCDALGEPGYTHSYSRYDSAGHCLEQQLIGQAGTVQTHYDACGRLKSLVAGVFSETVPHGGYDSVGNLLSKERTDSLGTTQCHYSYDGLNQLVSEEGVQVHRYLYDSLNNRLQVDEQKCEVNALNELLSQGDCQYQNDARGNRIADANAAYNYDALGRLIRVSKEDQCWEYEYDSFNRRLVRRHFEGEELSSEERFLYQGQNEVGAFDQDRELMQFRMLGQGFGAEIGAAVLVETKSGSYAPVHDQSGHMVALVDADTGEEKELMRYSAFGQEEIYTTAGERIEESSIGNAWRFASKRCDPETGFVNFGRRYYDPTTGRWISPDPKGFDDGPNLYAYVHNSPLTHFDEYGLYSRCFRYRSSPRVNYCRRCAYRPSPMRSMYNRFNAARRYVGSQLFNLSHSLGLVRPVRHVGMGVGRMVAGEKCDYLNEYYRRSERMGLDQRQGREHSLQGIATGQESLPLENERFYRDTEKLVHGKYIEKYYPQSRGLIGDTLLSLWMLFGGPANRIDHATMGLKELCRAALAEGKQAMWHAHSQGGIVTWRAIQRLTPEERSVLHVRTYGTAKVIGGNMGLASVKNYIARTDLVPRFLNLGHCRSARNGSNPDVTLVGPSGRLGLQHHSLEGEVYREIFEMEILKFDQRFNSE